MGEIRSLPEFTLVDNVARLESRLCAGRPEQGVFPGPALRV
jgi:hypothetical protein